MATTQAQFEFFDAQVRLWWNRLGMDISGYRLDTRMERLKERRAECRSNATDRIVEIVLHSRLAHDECAESQLADSALHEVVHALLLPLGALAFYRYVSREELDAAEHEVVRRLQCILLRSFGTP